MTKDPADSPTPSDPSPPDGDVRSLLDEIGTLCGAPPRGRADDGGSLTAAIARLERRSARAPADDPAGATPPAPPDGSAAPEAPFASEPGPTALPVRGGGAADGRTAASGPDSGSESASASGAGDDSDLELPGSFEAPADHPMEAGAPAESPADGEPTLRAIDDALADDAEVLLHGNFETVTAVLGEGAEGEDAPTGTPADEARPGGGPEAEDAVLEAAPPEDAGSVSVPDASAPPESAMLPERLPAREAPAEPPAPEPAPPEPVPEAAPPAVPPIEEPAVFVPPPAEPAPVPDTRTALDKLREGLVVLLVALNYPLRWLPARARPIVDWVALSLVFWVPIVWVVALLVVGP